MRGTPVAVCSGIGRRVAWAIIASGLVVLVAGVLLQAGKQQRQYRELHQQQLRQAASHAAMMVRSRLEDADLLLRSYVDAANPADESRLRSQLLQTSMFEDVVVVKSANEAELQAGGRPHLLRALPGRKSARWILAEIRAGWLWSGLRDSQSRVSLLAVDATGRQLYRTFEARSGAVSQVTSLLDQLSPDGAVQNLAWIEQDKAWVGAIASTGSGAMVAQDVDRPWSVAFWSAMRTQSTMLPLLLLLALGFAHFLAHNHVLVLRQLRRALAQLPGRRVLVEAPGALISEVRQLVETYNRSAEALESQADIHKAMNDINGLLLAGGDHEGVIDQVLTRVRGITRANNVGLTLLDAAVSGHGRMFAVNAEGGCPVSRVMLDAQMVDTLRQATHGLTVVRCEEGRHSFLDPLQSAGSTFFWIWPVVAAGELVAILSVGYTEPPADGARVAGCGTHCAERLGIALSGSARAEQLYRQAHFDPLTQLPNRLLFREQLRQDLHNVTEKGKRGALLYIDLDHFKKINDSLGHSAGDQVLSIVAQRLRACVKEDDTVARLGGDEFSVILRNITDVTTVSIVADRMIQSMHLPIRLGAGEHRVLASIGIALFPADGAELDELVRNADLAMYCAKDSGRGAAVFYNAKMANRGSRVVDSGLFRAVTRREFSLYFQPQYRVADGSMSGMEALLRWQKPRGGVAVPPAEFIPAAEESGLIIDLGGWVIDAVCAQIGQWREQGLAPPRIAMNLSAQQLRDPMLIESLKRALDRHVLQPSAIEFEMSEAALTDPDNLIGIEELSALGVRLTLDDFGTGHTALAHLRRYPVGAVKIDRSFIEELNINPSAAALASTIIVMAHSLGKQVIAEGVETLEQLEYLRERGCDCAQGYFMAQPLSVADMTDMLAGRKLEVTGRHSAFA